MLDIIDEFAKCFPCFRTSMFLFVMTSSAVCLFLFGFLFCFGDRVSLCSSGCFGTCFVDQANLELRDLPVSASTVLELKAC